MGVVAGLTPSSKPHAAGDENAGDGFLVPGPPPTAELFLERLAASIDYAFQPIVSLNSGRCFGVEALMRGWEATGLESIPAVLDYAYHAGVLIEADRILKRLALEKFIQIPHAHELRLFYNLDNRLFSSSDYDPTQTVWAIERFSLQPSTVVLEVSERNNLERADGTYRILKKYRDRTVQMALDDFGTGFSGLALLFDTNPEYVKIDRYFITDIGSDYKKKLFVSHVVNLSKTLGIRVIAEGVETKSEFYTCREIGCDMMQGYLLQRPTTDIRQLVIYYPAVTKLRAQDRRQRERGARWLHGQLDCAPPLDVSMKMEDILRAFRANPERSFFPFLDANQHPIGVIRETELKEYIYSPYGRDLLARKALADYMPLFVTRCPVADVNTSIDTILEQYSVSPSRDGIVITDDGRYLGVLSAEALVLAVQERNLELARDQNPLTKLPGNPSIDRFIEEISAEREPVFLLYLDIDNFKVFNDEYGFRLGDRVIRMFSEIVRKHFSGFGAFIGHVGGDDFFVGIQSEDFAAVRDAGMVVLEEFRSSAESLYNEQDRTAGYVMGINRQGERMKFPLMSGSCALAIVSPYSRDRSERGQSALIAQLKEEAKRACNTLCAASLP